MTVPQLRLLADELGWNVREDEEGVTVPVNELIPYFRRPVVRQLLAAKMRQVGRGRGSWGLPAPDEIVLQTWLAILGGRQPQPRELRLVPILQTNIGGYSRTMSSTL